LVNITGGTDLTLFEVDEVVNKIRAEVDPEAELNVGAIEDENLNGKIRVSIIATSLDGQEPEIKPVVSMVHRLQNRNVGYSDNVFNTLATNQATLNATEGATALNINSVADQNKVVQKRSEKEEINETPNDPSLENISIENATYLQNVQETNNNLETHSKLNDETPNFEVDSIELVTPQLFSDDEKSNSTSYGNNEENSPNIFNNPKSEESFETPVETDNKTKIIKEPEMFEESGLEEDFEIPAFLRKQKN